MLSSKMLAASSRSRLRITRDIIYSLLSETNLQGWIYIAELVVKQMLAQNTGASVTCIASATVEHPIEGVGASLPRITKGGLEAITRGLAREYVKDGIAFNALAPGVLSTSMTPGQYLKSRSPMGEIPEGDDIVQVVVYLTEARQVTGEVLQVDAGAHNRKR